MGKYDNAIEKFHQLAAITNELKEDPALLNMAATKFKRLSNLLKGIETRIESALNLVGAINKDNPLAAELQDLVEKARAAGLTIKDIVTHIKRLNENDTEETVF